MKKGLITLLTLPLFFVGCSSSNKLTENYTSLNEIKRHSPNDTQISLLLDPFQNGVKSYAKIILEKDTIQTNHIGRAQAELIQDKTYNAKITGEDFDSYKTSFTVKGRDLIIIYEPKRNLSGYPQANIIENLEK